MLTGYDALLLSVLVEAQAGRQETRTAGRCPLRGLRTAEVLRSDTPAMRLAAAGTLLTGSAGLRDKVADRDLPYGTRTVAGLAARRFESDGVRLAGRIGLEASPMLEAPALADQQQARAGATVDELLAPTGAVVATLFAHTAVAAARRDNVEALRAAGDAYGRLVHLLDAVDDRAEDARRGRFNPLAATGTSTSGAHRLALSLTGRIAAAIAEVSMADADLARVLLGPELGRAVSRSFRSESRPLAATQLVLSGGMLGLALCDSSRQRRRSGDRDRSSCADFADCCDPCACCGDCGVCDCSC
ncbi:MAG: hypothetical protein QOJ11_392 [Frankiales bacterium]|nr:hypothetical protein [Frankiales bacterium]